MTTVYKVCRVNRQGEFISAVIDGHNMFTYTLGQETISYTGPIFCMPNYEAAQWYLDIEFNGDKMAILECETTDEPVRLHKGLSSTFVSVIDKGNLREHWALQKRTGYFDFRLPDGTYGVSRLTPVHVVWRTL